MRRFPSVSCLVFITACAADAGIDTSTCGSPTVLRIDHVTLPVSNASARDLAFDLDHNRQVDNQLGMLAGTLRGQAMELDLSAAASKRLTDEPMWFIGLRSCDGFSAATLTRTPDVGDDIDLVGDDVLEGDNGQFPMSTMFDASSVFPDPGYLQITRGALELVPTGDRRWSGRLGVAVNVADTIATMGPPLLPVFDSHEIFLRYFDTSPIDGHVTFEEFQTNNLIRSLISADLDTLGISMAIGISATEI